MDPFVFATFFVAFISSLLSGLAGGGGFIMAPYWLISGMTPAQGASTGAFMAIGMGSSSLAAYKGSPHAPRERSMIRTLIILTAITSPVGPFFLPHVPTDAFKPVLAGLTFVTLPFLFIERRRLRLPVHGRFVGYAAMGILLLLSSFITSSAFSILMAVILARSFDLSTLQSTAVRRVIGIIQSVVTFVVLASLGNFVPAHAGMALAGGAIGSYIGTRISLRRGERFAKYALAGGALIGAVMLLA